MNKINTFIFDCFGVICSPVLNGWYKENRIKKGYVDEHIQDVLKEFDLGNLSEDDIISYFLKYDGVETDRNKLRVDIDSYLKLNEGLVEIILKLKQKGFKVVLLSNANNEFFARKIYTQFPEFKNLFDEIVISSLVKMVKPEPEIYKHTLEKIAKRPEHCFFIDDNETNVKAAIELGMEGHVFTDNQHFIDYLNKTEII